MNPVRPILAAALALAACVPGGSDGTGNGADVRGAQPPLAGARIGGAFALTDQNGRRTTERDFAGRYPIYYFGYSFCPDVCPVDLQKLMAGLRAFERRDPARAARVQPVFVTIDPDRDTSAVLRAYAAAFHPRLRALTGTPAQIAAIARAFGVYYAKAPQAGSVDYLMDHSRQAYLFGPDGAPIALLPADGTPDAVAAELARWVR